MKIRRRRSPDAPVWRVVPSGDPRVRAFVQPGEECLEPILGAVDWQRYLATLDQRPRARWVRFCSRELMITDRRLLAFNMTERYFAEIPLAAISELQVIDHPPGGVKVAAGEHVIRIMWIVEDGRTKFVDFSTSEAEAQSFVARLKQSVAEVKLAAFGIEQGDLSLSDPRAGEALRLLHEASRVRVPPIVLFRAGPALAQPVVAQLQCPECGERLRPVGNKMTYCSPCLLLWCDSGVEPEVSESGRIEGAKEALEAFVPGIDLSAVRCYSLIDDLVG